MQNMQKYALPSILTLLMARPGRRPALYTERASQEAMPAANFSPTEMFGSGMLFSCMVTLRPELLSIQGES